MEGRSQEIENPADSAVPVAEEEEAQEAGKFRLQQFQNSDLISGQKDRAR